MRIVLTAYAIASLVLALAGFLANRDAQMQRQEVLRRLRQLHPRDESNAQFYQDDYPAIEEALHRSEVNTLDFAHFGEGSFILTMLLFAGYSLFKKKDPQRP
jgi:hypothetical protein